MQTTTVAHLNALLKDHGAFVIVSPGVDELFIKLETIPYKFEGTKGPCESPTWLMEPQHINTPSSGKESYFMFDPINKPGHFGNELVNYIKHVHGTSYEEEKTIGDYIEEKGLASPAGIHYYKYKPTVDKGELGQHNDVNWWTIINTNGPISLWVDKWLMFSKNENDAPDYILPKDSLIVMRGLSAAIIEGGSPVLHKVTNVTRQKFTIGLFLELKDKTRVLTIPDGDGQKEITVADFSSSYFGVTEVFPAIYNMKHTFVRC